MAPIRSLQLPDEALRASPLCKALGALHMRVISLIGILLLSAFAEAQIPEWYKRDIVNIIQKAEGVVIYKVKRVALHSVNGLHHSYKIDTATVEELKGKAPKGRCYFIQTEGKWNSPPAVGETGIVILNIKYSGECGAIEPGYGAPATEDYVSLFKSIVKTGT